MPISTSDTVAAGVSALMFVELSHGLCDRMLGYHRPANCKYDPVVYDNLYIINKHFSKKKIEILYSEITMNTNTTKCSNISANNQYMNVQIRQNRIPQLKH